MNDIRSRVIELDINDVLPNRFQPRVKFNEDAIIELSESIKEHGIIQPIIVRPIGDKYEIIAGERRYKASILAGKETIPAIVTDLNDKDSAEIALIENVQRKNLTPVEEAVSYKKILDMGYLTQEQLALKLGKSQSSIANKMRLLHLSDEVQEALIEEKISERHARSLLKLTTAERQNQLLERIINERLTVRKTDEEIEKMNEGISMVEEPESPINAGAFINTNPGFVDVNKIENQAQELKPETPKVDINALLQPNSSRVGSDTQPFNTNSNENTSTRTSIFDLLTKKEPASDNSIFNKPIDTTTFEPLSFEPKKEESPYKFEPLPVEEEKEEETYKFEPLPADEVKSEPVGFTNLSSFGNVQNSVIEDVKPIEKPISNDTLMNPYKEVEVIEPVMPTIDLSKFTPSQTISEPEILDIGAPLIEPITMPSIVTPTPTIAEVKETPITPIIITDYDKQYDPIMPKVEEEIIPKLEFREVINTVRDTATSIERAGYYIDTDEVDLGTEYRIIITIKK